MNIDYLIPLMEDALRMNVIVGPSLMATGEGGLDDKTYSAIQGISRNLTNMLWSSPGDSTFFSREAPQSVIELCVLETLSSTTAYYSHLRLGELTLSDSMMAVTESFFKQLTRRHSPTQVLEVNLLVNFYDSAQAIRHYGRMSKQDFVSGRLHRPWIRYNLEYELKLMLEQGSVEVVQDDEEYLRLTEGGSENLQMVTSFLTETGFLKKRSSLMRFSRFSDLDDYDELIEGVLPAREVRQSLLTHNEIQPGMRVLELGCGTGGLTIDTHLYKLVEPYGSIVATDPSLGMLRRGQRKADNIGISNVEFVPMAAEELNFNDHSFDAVTGVLFLHFTNMERAINEIHRVLKPGGVFSTIHALEFTQSSTLVPDWFKPLLELSPTPRNSDSLPKPEQAPNILKRKRGYPVSSANVKVLEETAAFRSLLNHSPWKFRRLYR